MVIGEKRDGNDTQEGLEKEIFEGSSQKSARKKKKKNFVRLYPWGQRLGGVPDWGWIPRVLGKDDVESLEWTRLGGSRTRPVEGVG
jgi:hypothetical protein